MATDSLSPPQPGTFAASRLPSFLRAVADPDGKGEISPEREATLQQIETNLARYCEAVPSPPHGRDGG